MQKRLFPSRCVLLSHRQESWNSRSSQRAPLLAGCVLAPPSSMFADVLYSKSQINVTFSQRGLVVHPFLSVWIKLVLSNSKWGQVGSIQQPHSLQPKHVQKVNILKNDQQGNQEPSAKTRTKPYGETAFWPTSGTACRGPSRLQRQ